MRPVVLDASVIVKWLVPERDGEEDVDRALALFEAVVRREIEPVQPVHWLAEVAAVLARLSPDTAADDVRDLMNMDLAVETTPETWARAVELSTALGHHLFDTLYHAVALSVPDAELVTADRRYHAKAADFGDIVPLSQFLVG